MLTKPKQIVLDKDVFTGTNLDELCDFARDHLLLVPHVLLYECATSENREKMKLLQRFEKLVKGGAYYCPIGGVCPMGGLAMPAISFVFGGFRRDGEDSL